MSNPHEGSHDTHLGTSTEIFVNNKGTHQPFVTAITRNVHNAHPYSKHGYVPNFNG